MTFWSEPLGQLGTKDPKRNYRFQVIFNGFNDEVIWYAKTITKPSLQIGETEHKYLGHTFYYPGVATWTTVTMTLVDPVSPAAAAQMNALIRASGYRVPGGTTAADLETMSKAKAAAALGGVQIIQMDAGGLPLETWTLINPFITELKFGDLDYSDDALAELSMTMRYDYATCEIGTSADGARVDLFGASATTPPAAKSFFKNTDN